MNIIAVLRAVRDPASFSVNRRAQKIFVHRDHFSLNPSDHNALEAGLALADAGHSLAAVAYGGAPAEDVLRQALAAGAGRALLAADPALQDADAGRLTDVVCRLIEQASESGAGPDLVVLGAEVLDADLAQLGPRLAAALDWPFIGGACGVSLPEGQQRAVQAIVEVGSGYRCFEASLPAVVAVARDSNKPRYAPAAEIIRVFSDESAVQRLSHEALGADTPQATPQAALRGQSFPADRELGRRFEGSAEDLARQLRQVASSNKATG